MPLVATPEGSENISEEEYALRMGDRYTKPPQLVLSDLIKKLVENGIISASDADMVEKKVNK